MKFTKVITKLALAGALLGSVEVTATALNTTTVSAESLQTAKTKDYNKLLQLSKVPGKHYIGTRKFYASWVPGNNVGNAYLSKPYKLANITMNPGREWATAVGAGYIHGQQYIIEHQSDSVEMLIPAEFYHVPYGFKFKKNHAPVECYYGSLAESWNGYDEYSGEYEGDYTKNNTIYSDRKDGHRKLTLSYDGQDHGKNQGFFIGLTAIHMNDNHDYYPVYSYSVDGNLGVVYIRTEDIDQFKPAKVTYKSIGTLNKTKGKNYYHSFKPYKNRVDY
ncbi:MULTISPECIES: hypothetical protein [unclassified Lactobacillus]|uniref:hypothetical protein n=1 Tax=unclassified Lactobacillus TaxID=2620435 RepID=UPI00226A829D|nr:MULTISPECIES: hypothetical protein [unclassified Lactobacillus]MCX8720123.1 hypothetical protein [Lactobacillus sp. B4010]MCX8733292.1 hypothetical protein [Lactobacillus sp. B4015]MCX8735413.1 hypothetical protein [Lactobacillus sp. B4012]